MSRRAPDAFRRSGRADTFPNTRSRQRAATAVLVAIVSALLLAGCASSSPTTQWAAGRAALTAAQDSILSLHAGGVVSDVELVGLDQAVQAARAALDLAETQLPEGGQTFDDAMAVVQAALDQLLELEAARAGGQPDLSEGGNE